MITVYHNGSGLMLHEIAARELGYSGGESLSKGEVMAAIRVNAAAGIASCKLALTQRNSKESSDVK